MKHRSRFKVVSSGHHLCSVVVAPLRNGDGKGTVELEECAELLPGAPRRGGLLRTRAEDQRGMERRRGEEIAAARGPALRGIPRIVRESTPATGRPVDATIDRHAPVKGTSGCESPHLL